jgi:hypothetical protein
LAIKQIWAYILEALLHHTVYFTRLAKRDGREGEIRTRELTRFQIEEGDHSLTSRMKTDQLDVAHPSDLPFAISFTLRSGSGLLSQYLPSQDGVQ